MLNYQIIDFADSSLNKTAVLVTGENDAMMVDAGFTRADGHRIVAAVLDSGKSLQNVAITGGDPDFYFGAEVIADAFPDARFLAPADVITHIRDSYRGKLTAWAHLGVNLPTRLVDIGELTGPLTVDGVQIEVRNDSPMLADRAWYLWEPQDHSLFGGVLVFGGLHAWTADSPTPESRVEWIRVLDGLLKLNPVLVVPGHRAANSPADSSAITHTRDYLEAFEKVVADSPNGDAAEAALLAAYPTAGLTSAPGLGAKVAKGEMAWG